MRPKLIVLKRFLLLVLLLNSKGLLSQTGIFTFYSINEGLAQSTVMDLYKDPGGLLWVGTGEGLSLWDGYSFRNIKHHYNEPNGLSNNLVRYLLPDKLSKCVWVGTESGLNCFNEKGTTIIDKLVVPEWAANGHVPLMASDTALWIFVTGKGIFRINKHTHQYYLVKQDQVYFFLKMLPGTDVLCYQDNHHQYVRIHLLTGEASVEKTPGTEKDFYFTEIIPWKNGYLVASSNGMWTSDKQGTNLKKVFIQSGLFDSSKDKFGSLAADSSGRIWFSVEGKGLFSCDMELSHVRAQHWQQNGENIRSSLLSVRKIICDAYNVLWMATDGEGLIRYNGNRILFNEQFTASPVTDSAHWFIRAFHEEQNIAWIGTHNEGLKSVDYSTGEIKTYSSPLFSSIYFLRKGTGNTLLLGTDSGVCEFSNGKFTPYTLSPQSNTSQLFKNSLRLRDGRCIVASSQRVYMLDEQQKKLTWPGNSSGNFSGMIELKNGTIVCAASYRGLFFYDAALKLVKEVTFKELGLPVATTVTDFLEAENGTVWASSSLGLLQFDPSFHLVKVFTDKEGLPDNMLYGLQQLPGGEMIIATGNGVSIMDPAAQTFRNFTTADGLRSNECNTRSLYFSPEHNLYIGGIKGFVRKHFPVSVKTFPGAICFIENFRINDSLSVQPALPDELKYFQNSISFDLRYSDFAFSETYHWAYRIDGLDSSLVNVPAGTHFRFPALPPGAYHFHAFLPGHATGEIYSFAFTIYPPWWQTGLAKLLFALTAVMLVIGAVYFISVYRYKIRLRKMEELQMIEKIRTRISGDIHDDLGAGLTRIALTSELVSMQLKEDEAMRRKVGGMATVARELSQSLKEVVWSVKPEHDNLESIISYFKGYCGEFFENTTIAFTFSVTTPVTAIPVSPEMRRNLFLIMKEALNNTVKHSHATNARVIISQTEKSFTMKIEDDGTGIALQEMSMINSSGLLNMRKRAEAIGMAFSMEDAAPGTRITVSGRIN